VINPVIPRNCQMNGSDISARDHLVGPIKDDARNRLASVGRTSTLNLGVSEGQILQEFQLILGYIGCLHEVATEKVSTC